MVKLVPTAIPVPAILQIFNCPVAGRLVNRATVSSEISPATIVNTPLSPGRFLLTRRSAGSAVMSVSTASGLAASVTVTEPAGT